MEEDRPVVEEGMLAAVEEGSLAEKKQKRFLLSAGKIIHKGEKSDEMGLIPACVHACMSQCMHMSMMSMVPC
jgi:hypothetical protein